MKKGPELRYDCVKIVVDSLRMSFRWDNALERRQQLQAAMCDIVPAAAALESYILMGTVPVLMVGSASALSQAEQSEPQVRRKDRR